MTDRERIRDYVHANEGVDEWDIAKALELPIFEVVDHCKFLVANDVIKPDGKPCRHPGVFRGGYCSKCEGWAL